MNNIDKFKGFSNGEMYMLQCQAIETSLNMLSSGKYGDWERQTHNELLRDITEEVTRRQL